MGSWNAVRTFNEYKQPRLLNCYAVAGLAELEGLKPGSKGTAYRQTAAQLRQLLQVLQLCQISLDIS